MTAGTAAPSCFDVDLPTIDMLSEDYQRDPHGENARALARGPIGRGPMGVEVLSHAAAQEVLRDPRFRMPQGLALSFEGITSGPVWDRVIKGILSLDGPEHQRLRRLVVHAFRPRAAEQRRSSMQAVITELVDPLLSAGRCDVVTDIARPYPIAVICELLGTPRDDWELFSHWTDDIFKIFNFNVANDSDDIVRSWDELDAYLDALVAKRRQSLSDDLVSDLIRAEDDGDRLTHEEMLMLIGAVLTAGTDTTRNQLAAMVQVLSDHPDQWQLLREQPDLAPRAVDELMRHSPIIFGTIRVASEDVELCGLTIPAGTLVNVNTSAANRDPAVFADPARLDVTREIGPTAMLTFGGGVHYCLGVHLAKMELAEALRVLTQRMASVRVTAPVEWKPVVGISGPVALPIEFEAA